jgi:hypothetical protein
MTFLEKSGMRGLFTMRLYKKGKLIETYQDNNLIVDAAREIAAQLISGAGAGRTITHIAFGVSGASPQPSDTAITDPYSKAVESISYPAFNQAQFHWNLHTTEANGKDIFEFGLICADGTLYARKVRDRAFPKNADFALEGEWIIIF